MASALWTNKYVGIPYQAHGRTLRGADCYGLARIVLENEYGIKLPSYDSDYTESIEREALENILEGRNDWVRIASPQEGDIIILRARVNYFHVGIMVSPSRFLNCRPNVGSVVEELSSPFWSSKIEGFYRHTSQKE